MGHGVGRLGEDPRPCLADRRRSRLTATTSSSASSAAASTTSSSSSATSAAAAATSATSAAAAAAASSSSAPCLQRLVVPGVRVTPVRLLHDQLNVRLFELVRR